MKILKEDMPATKHEEVEIKSMCDQRKTRIKIAKIKAARPQLTLLGAKSAREDKLETHHENRAGMFGKRKGMFQER